MYVLSVTVSLRVVSKIEELVYPYVVERYCDNEATDGGRARDHGIANFSQRCKNPMSSKTYRIELS